MKENFDNVAYDIGTKSYDGVFKGECWETGFPDAIVDKTGLYGPLIYQTEFDMSDNGKGKCLVTGAKLAFEKKGYLIHGQSIATHNYIVPSDVTGNLYLGCWLFEYIILDTYAIKNPEYGFYIVYKTDNMNNWDTVYAANKKVIHIILLKNLEHQTTMICKDIGKKYYLNCLMKQKMQITLLSSSMLLLAQ